MKEGLPFFRTPGRKAPLHCPQNTDIGKPGTAKHFWKPIGRRSLCTRWQKLPLTKPGLQKLPKVKELDAEFAELLTKKKATYPDYRKARDEMQELVRAQKNVERFFAEEKNTTEKTQTR